MRQTPTAAVDLVREFEGLHEKVHLHTPVQVVPYVCPAGYWTIGYGHLCAQDHPQIDERQATDYLYGDLGWAELTVIRACPAGLVMPPGQFGALVSFVFNLGSGAFKASTLRRKVNAGDHVGAAGEFGRWVFSGGRKLPGLIRRRAEEAAMYAGA